MVQQQIALLPCLSRSPESLFKRSIVISLQPFVLGEDFRVIGVPDQTLSDKVPVTRKEGWVLFFEFYLTALQVVQIDRRTFFPGCTKFQQRLLVRSRSQKLQHPVINNYPRETTLWTFEVICSNYDWPVYNFPTLNELRISCTSAHTEAHIARLVATLTKVAGCLGIERQTEPPFMPRKRPSGIPDSNLYLTVSS